MDVDRRRFVAGLGGLAITGCSRAEARPGVDWATFKTNLNVYANRFFKIQSEEVNVLWTTRKWVNVD